MSTPKRILVLGSGGREHALAWRLSHDPGVERVLVGPGNPGIERDAGIRGVAELCGDVDLADHAAIARLVQETFSLPSPPLEETERCLTTFFDEGLIR